MVVSVLGESQKLFWDLTWYGLSLLMWRYKNIQKERHERFEHEWEQTRSILTLYANLHRDPKQPPYRPEDFVRLSYDKTDTQVNLHDNPQLLEEFKKRFKFNKRKRG